MNGSLPEDEMLVACDRSVDLPFAVLAARIEGMADRLHSWSVAAREAGGALQATVGAGRIAAKTVHLEVGPSLRTSRAISVLIDWEAAGAAGLFPRMEGELIAVEEAGDSCRLSFRGSYRPPLGWPGRLADRVALHQVAEATVEDFFDRLVGYLLRAA